MHVLLLLAVLAAPVPPEEPEPPARDGVCGVKATVLRRQSTAVWLELDGAAVPFLTHDSTRLVGLESTADLEPGLPVTIDSSVHHGVINRLDAVAGPGATLEGCVASSL